MTATYDAVILGAGHNALILQAYLGHAGLSTISLERRDHAGGGLETIEYPRVSGFSHNTHSFFHRALNRLPWYADLNLERRGAVYIEPELNVAMVLRDGRVLQWWTDFEKTVASFADFSEQDAENLRRWREAFLPIASQILVPESQSPPLPLNERRKLLEGSSPGRLLLKTSAMSPIEFVRREFENPIIQAGLLFFNGLREVDLRLPGFGHHIPALLANDGMSQMCLGGSKQLAYALIDVVCETGGEILVDTTPKKIVVEAGRAAGVETVCGQTIRARRLIASSLNPQQTFLTLIDHEHLPGPWIEKASAFQYNLLAPLFSLNLNLADPPNYLAAQQLPQIDKALMVILGLEHIDQFMEIVQHHERGTIPPTVMWGACPTQFDASQAPTGRHTAFMWEKLPYRLNGKPKNWDNAKESHGRDMLRLWSEYAPNVSDAIDSFTRSPLDVQHSLWNMQDGDLLVGAFMGGQVGFHRPFPGAGHYRGHVDGLYLCGSSCHPGGNITGLPAYNAAQVILADLKIKADHFHET